MLNYGYCFCIKDKYLPKYNFLFGHKSYYTCENILEIEVIDQFQPETLCSLAPEGGWVFPSIM